ncbi:Glyoxalase-like domain-containing protein [Artemisia annua]|uniref:Glyoxalase-like domain-containing protein n=1 Tax=Artemisia annua TaxID=35608 RepID=A0A2U1LZ78_ARTAN|nr:Glyoxalase-like domain-containing protein [Artemisia annua]
MAHKKENNNNNGDDHTQKRDESGDELPLMSLNHISRVCKSVNDSVEFYTKALGFVLIERPKALDFDGAWLFNYGIGIHLVQSKDEDKLPNNHELDPMDNHISFQCEDMEALERKLKERGIKCMKRTVGGKEDGEIDQLFFNDPDGFMIEICNCENVKLKPMGSIGRLKLPLDKHNPPVELDSNAAKAS